MQEPQSKPARRLTRSKVRYLFVLALGIAVLAGLVVALDWEQLLRAIGEAKWEYIPLALFFTGISYLLVGYSFARVSRLFGIRMSECELAEVGFVSIVLNHVLTTGGVFGYTLRYLVMRRRGVALKDVVAASVLHFYLTSLVILAFLPVSIVYLLLNSTIRQVGATFLALVTIILVTLSTLSTLMIFLGPLRRIILQVIVRMTHRLTRRPIEKYLRNFDETMERGLAVIRHQPANLPVILLWIVLDWVTAIVSLGVCFYAFGVPVRPGQVLTGFVIGVIAGVLSMLPGGLGVQEGSMAGIFALMGVSFERAVLAAVLFRAVYYLVPYLVSFVFYWRLIRIPGRAPRRRDELPLGGAFPDIDDLI